MGTYSVDCEAAFFSRVEPRLELTRRVDDHLREDWHAIWRAVHRQESHVDAPLGYDLRETSRPDRPERPITILQQGADLRFAPADAYPGTWGSPLASTRTRSLELIVQPVRFWRDGRPPSWAVDWGTDKYGAWVAFQCKGVRQRMRWIPPGTFQMGSREDEPERYGEEYGDWNEGPQHQVTVSHGFWLFDTSCTQALWQTVMGDNPSRFTGPDRPVEQVSWEDCQRFLTKINEVVPGLALSLPTEAQWEYACRAGTSTPFSFGVNITTE